MEDLLQLEVYPPRQASRLPQPMSEVYSPLNWKEWDRLLAHHPDQRIRADIVGGIRQGFRIGFGGKHELCRTSKNMPSALEKPAVIRDYLAKECSEGRVLGPLDPSCLPQVYISRFGVMPKGSTGKWCHMSSPSGTSVNDGISKSLCSLSYVNIWDAAHCVVDKGVCVLMAKADIQHAYRNIPDDRWLMGMQWEGGLFVDTTLPFGLCSAPKIFNAVVLRQQGVDCAIHYPDDFLLVGRPSSEECAVALSTLLEVFDHLGLPVALEKLEGPTSCLIFLGFQLHSEVCLPHSKLEELLRLLRSWLGRKELESLVGKLAHASTVVKPGEHLRGECLSYWQEPGRHFITSGTACPFSLTGFGG